MKVCSIQDCGTKVVAFNYCNKHYKRFKAYGDPMFIKTRVFEIKGCAVEGCKRTHSSKGYCHQHYTRWRVHGDPLVSLKAGGKCCIEGCESKIEAHKLCTKHYARLKAHGDASIRSVRELSAAERIISNSCTNEQTDCWIFTGTKDLFGYGAISINGLVEKAHRHSYLAFRGEIPEGMLVCHHCDTPSCVNPNHLFIGTHQDNMNDKINKGRAITPKGEQHYKSKLSEQDVIKIRLMAKKGLSETIIAEEFNVSRGAISSIKYNYTWKHVKVES